MFTDLKHVACLYPKPRWRSNYVPYGCSRRWQGSQMTKILVGIPRKDLSRFPTLLSWGNPMGSHKPTVLLWWPVRFPGLELGSRPYGGWEDASVNNQCYWNRVTVKWSLRGTRHTHTTKIKMSSSEHLRRIRFVRIQVLYGTDKNLDFLLRNITEFQESLKTLCG